MPLYEFSCESCEQTSEHLMKISDPNPEICPVCGAKHTLKKLVSRSNFVLKGTGWYETDFKGTPEKKITSTQGAAKKTETSSSKKETPASSSVPSAS
jgi:putative FmdB family regulatory protein